MILGKTKMTPMVKFWKSTLILIVIFTSISCNDDLNPRFQSPPYGYHVNTMTETCNGCETKFEYDAGGKVVNDGLVYEGERLVISNDKIPHPTNTGYFDAEYWIEPGNYFYDEEDQLTRIILGGSTVTDLKMEYDKAGQLTTLEETIINLNVDNDIHITKYDIHYPSPKKIVVSYEDLKGNQIEYHFLLDAGKNPFPEAYRIVTLHQIPFSIPIFVSNNNANSYYRYKNQKLFESAEYDIEYNQYGFPTYFGSYSFEYSE